MDPQQMVQPYSGTMGGGLPVHTNPLAQKLQSQGRGEDSMLVHMTPHEVGGLQALAMAHGGSLTINPETGLPEAGWLGKLLPLLVGVGLNLALPGVGAAIGSALGGIGGAAGTGVLVGAGTTAITGDLKKGLMAGLSAYGGASLAGGIKGAISGAVAPTAAAPAAATEVAKTAGTEAVKTAGTEAAQQTAQAVAKKGLGGFMQGFANTAKGVPLGGGPAATGFLAKAAVPMAISGAYGGISNAFAPKGGDGGQSGAVDNSYQGPYSNEQRNVIAAPQAAELKDPAFSGERTWFDRSVPGVFNAQGQQVLPGSNTAPGTMLMTPMLNPNAKKGQPMYSFSPQPYMGQQEEEEQQMPGYADGGVVHMSAGSFVMPARETAEFGKGSGRAGQKILAGLGGIPINGPGDGTSDSIRASIGGREARVADGEVHFPPEAVRRIGKGSEKRGTDKLYAMMKRAEQSRKKAARGGDGLNVAKGLRAV